MPAEGNEQAEWSMAVNIANQDPGSLNSWRQTGQPAQFVQNINEGSTMMSHRQPAHASQQVGMYQNLPHEANCHRPIDDSQAY